MHRCPERSGVPGECKLWRAPLEAGRDHRADRVYRLVDLANRCGSRRPHL